MVLTDRGRVRAISYPPLGFQDMGNLVIDVELNSVRRDSNLAVPETPSAPWLYI